MAERPSLPRVLRAMALGGPCLAFALLLAGIEATVRWTQPHISSLEALVRSPRQRADFTDAREVGIFEGDPLLLWRLKPGLRDVIWDFTLVSTDRHGLRARGPRAPRRPGTLRLVCLGDSVTFGYRVPVVFPEQPRPEAPGGLPYPMLIEDWLHEANPGREVEALILAVPGYSSHQGLAWLRREIARLSPDVVTACFGWNDIGLRPAPDSETMAMGWSHVLARDTLVRSQALIRASLWLGSRTQRRRGGEFEPRVSRRAFVGNHLAIARVAREHGAEVLVIAPVYRDAETFPDEAARLARHRQALREGMGAEDIPFLQVDALTETAFPDNRHLFGETIHPNDRGHDMLARAILDRLTSRGVLERHSLSNPRNAGG